MRPVDSSHHTRSPLAQQADPRKRQAVGRWQNMAPKAVTCVADDIEEPLPSLIVPKSFGNPSSPPVSSNGSSSKCEVSSAKCVPSLPEAVVSESFILSSKERMTNGPFTHSKLLHKTFD